MADRNANHNREIHNGHLQEARSTTASRRGRGANVVRRTGGPVRRTGASGRPRQSGQPYHRPAARSSSNQRTDLDALYFNPVHFSSFRDTSLRVQPATRHSTPQDPLNPYGQSSATARASSSTSADRGGRETTPASAFARVLDSSDSSVDASPNWMSISDHPASPGLHRTSGRDPSWAVTTINISDPSTTSVRTVEQSSQLLSSGTHRAMQLTSLTATPFSERPIPSGWDRVVAGQVPYEIASFSADLAVQNYRTGLRDALLHFNDQQEPTATASSSRGITSVQQRPSQTTLTPSPSPSQADPIQSVNVENLEEISAPTHMPEAASSNDLDADSMNELATTLAGTSLSLPTSMPHANTTGLATARQQRHGALHILCVLESQYGTNLNQVGLAVRPIMIRLASVAREIRELLSGDLTMVDTFPQLDVAALYLETFEQSWKAEETRCWEQLVRLVKEYEVTFREDMDQRALRQHVLRFSQRRTAILQNAGTTLNGLTRQWSSTNPELVAASDLILSDLAVAVSDGMRQLQDLIARRALSPATEVSSGLLELRDTAETDRLMIAD